MLTNAARQISMLCLVLFSGMVALAALTGCSDGSGADLGGAGAGTNPTPNPNPNPNPDPTPDPDPVPVPVVGFTPSNGSGGTIAPGTIGVTAGGATIYCPTSYQPSQYASPVIFLFNMDVNQFQTLANADRAFLVDTNSYNDVNLIFTRVNEALGILQTQYNIDLARLYFAGWSAGGNICMLYLTDPQNQQTVVAGIMTFPGTGGNTAYNNCRNNTGRKCGLYYAVGDQDTATGYYPGAVNEAQAIAALPGWASKVTYKVWPGQGHGLNQAARDAAWAVIKNYNLVNN